MTVFSYIHLIATVVYVFLGILAIAKNARSALNWFCAATLFSFALFAFSDIFHTMMPRIPDAQGHLFGRIGSTGGYLFPGFFLLFTLALTERKRLLRSWRTYVPLGLFMIGFNVVQWTGLGGVGDKHGPRGWISDWSGIWGAIYIAYYLSAIVLGLVLIARFGARARESRQRRQAGVIFTTALVSLVLGTANDVVLLTVAPNLTVELAASFTLIWAVGLFFSITRYGLLSFTPQAAAGQILATMLDPLLLVNPDGSIVTANQATEDLLGYSRSDLTNQSAGTVFVRPGEFETVLRKVLVEGQVNGVEVACKAKQGPDVQTLLSARIMRSDGSVLGSVWVLRDITQLKKAEEEIRTKSEHLESLNQALNEERAKLLELTGQLTRANEELKVLSEAKSDFVAAASHDLRTPLTTIIEGIAMTEDGTLGPVNEEQKKFLRYAHEDAERLSELINNLLDVRKIEQGRMEAHATNIRTAEVLRRISVSYMNVARDKGITLAVDVPDDLPPTYCDAGHYHRVVANLLSNAIKFTPAGGRIDVRAKFRPEGARSEGQVAGDETKALSPLTSMIEVGVADTGLGIPADEHHRIFGRFEQVRRATLEVVAGTGLGLSLCKQLVELNGGTIGFTSEEHKGSTFFFRLPAGRT